MTTATDDDERDPDGERRRGGDRPRDGETIAQPPPREHVAFAGREVAIDVAKIMQIPAPRALQVGYCWAAKQPPHADPKIEEAEAWLHEHLAEQVTVDQLAKHVA